MIKGITFDSQQISAANMGHFMNVFSGEQSGITQGCAVTYDSSNIYMAAGYLLLKGRQVQIVGTQTIPLETVASGELYCKTVFEIDLTKTNTTSSFLQGTIKTLTSSSGYPSVTQQDIDNGGTLYTKGTDAETGETVYNTTKTCPVSDFCIVRNCTIILETCNICRVCNDITCKSTNSQYA